MQHLSENVVDLLDLATVLLSSRSWGPALVGGFLSCLYLSILGHMTGYVLETLDQMTPCPVLVEAVLLFPIISPVDCSVFLLLRL